MEACNLVCFGITGKPLLTMRDSDDMSRAVTATPARNTYLLTYRSEVNVNFAPRQDITTLACPQKKEWRFAKFLVL